MMMMMLMGSSTPHLTPSVPDFDSHVTAAISTQHVQCGARKVSQLFSAPLYVHTRLYWRREIERKTLAAEADDRLIY